MSFQALAFPSHLFYFPEFFFFLFNLLHGCTEEESIAGSKACSICRRSRQTPCSPLAEYQHTINKPTAWKLSNSRAFVTTKKKKKDSFELAIAFLRITLLFCIADCSCLISRHTSSLSPFIQGWYKEEFLKYVLVIDNPQRVCFGRRAKEGNWHYFFFKLFFLSSSRPNENSAKWWETIQGNSKLFVCSSAPPCIWSIFVVPAVVTWDRFEYNYVLECLLLHLEMRKLCLPSAASVDNNKQVQRAQAVLVRGREGEREGEVRWT